MMSGTPEIALGVFPHLPAILSSELPSGKIVVQDRSMDVSFFVFFLFSFLFSFRTCCAQKAQRHKPSKLDSSKPGDLNNSDSHSGDTVSNPTYCKTAEQTAEQHAIGPARSNKVNTAVRSRRLLVECDNVNKQRQAKVSPSHDVSYDYFMFLFVVVALGAQRYKATN